MVKLVNMDELQHFGEYGLLTPLTQNDPRSYFRPISFVEGGQTYVCA